MSLPDYPLDEDSWEVCSCGNWAGIGKRTCYECDVDFKDLYADAAIQDAKEKS